MPKTCIHQCRKPCVCFYAGTEYPWMENLCRILRNSEIFRHRNQYNFHLPHFASLRQLDEPKNHHYTLRICWGITCHFFNCNNTMLLLSIICFKIFTKIFTLIFLYWYSLYYISFSNYISEYYEIFLYYYFNNHL